MRRRLPVVVLLILVAGGLWGWVRWSQAPEHKVRRLLAEIQELLSFRASDGNLAVLADSRRLGELFTADAEVRVEAEGLPGETLSGREAIIQTAVAARRAAGDLDVELLDVVVTVNADGRSAEASATGRVRETEEREEWIQRLRFRFVETADGWRIARVETVRTLTRVRPAMGSADRFATAA